MFKLDILFPLVQDYPYSYVYEDTNIVVGHRVVASLRNQIRSGIVVAQEKLAQRPPELKTVSHVLDETPFLPPFCIEFISFLSKYYATSLGEVLKFILPNGTLPTTKKIVKLNFLPQIEEWESYIGKSKLKYEILKILRDEETLAVKKLEDRLQKTLSSQLNDLAKKQLISFHYEINDPPVKEKMDALIHPLSDKALILPKIRKNAYAQLEILDVLSELTQPIEKSLLTKMDLVSAPALNALIKKGFVRSELIEVERKTFQPEDVGKHQFELTDEQSVAVQSILKTLGHFRPHLLFGITGSGKTLVYIEVLKQVVLQGKTAIILIPEISLTPQTVARFKSVFGDTIAILHSRMTDGERYDAWRLMRDGKYKIAVGPRSAVLAPLDHLGLIVVDEEHEWSYKQSDQVPRYSARDFAVYRAKHSKCPIILGSATPSIESYYNTQTKRYDILTLKERPNDAVLPDVHVVDLKHELEDRPAKDQIIISEKLELAIERRLLKKEQIILFQNKRGYSSFIQCKDCGHIEECPKCSITLVFHKTNRLLKCHYCGFEKVAQASCVKCKSFEVELKGFGTQRIEETIKTYFPHARVLRMDQDSTRKKNAHHDILRKFGSHEADILVGTQMITKGLDFPNVTLVGVLNADLALGIPDFRSAERTYQLISQVAGRAGRGQKKGDVMIQTFQPDHYAIQYAKNHDYEGFYKEDLLSRQGLDYPPYSKLINVRLSCINQSELYEALEMLKFQVNRLVGNLGKVLGPAPCPIERINEKYRWQLIIKVNRSFDPAGYRIKEILKQTRSMIYSKFKSVIVAIDVDPVDLI